MNLNPGITVALKILGVSCSEWYYSMVSLKQSTSYSILNTKIQTFYHVTVTKKTQF